MRDAAPHIDALEGLRRTLGEARAGVALALTIVITAAGCTQSRDANHGRAGRAYAGTVTIDGSSTMQPLAQRVADAFRQQHPDITVTVGRSDTGPGLAKLCAGAVDMAAASRPINAAEIGDCSAMGIEFVELPVAFDSLSVIVSSRNTFVDCLSVSELRRMWEPAAQGRVARWNQIRAGFPARPVRLVGPGGEAGTFDYFTLAVVGEQGSSRTDYTRIEDYDALAQAVGDDPNALGFVGYAYYAAHKDALKLVGIDGGSGCVVPSGETVAENTYRPLARPMFLYVNGDAARRTEVRALAHAFVAPERSRDVTAAGYMALPVATLLSAARRLDDGVTGSLFGGRGAVLGLTADVLQDEDKIKSALVR